MEHLSASEIYEKHEQAFQNLEFDDRSAGRRFHNKAEVREFLLTGGILPELWRECAAVSLPVGKTFLLYCLRDFNSDEDRQIFKKAFIKALNSIDIP